MNKNEEIELRYLEAENRPPGPDPIGEDQFEGKNHQTAAEIQPNADPQNQYIRRRTTVREVRESPAENPF